MRRISAEDLEAKKLQFQQDEHAARRVLASPDGEALIRYLRVLWSRRGVGGTPEQTAYRVAQRDAVEQLEDMRKDGRA